MVFKIIIFQNRYVELETPPPFMEKTILNFLFDYLNPSHSRGVKKTGYFTVRLTVSIYPGPAPPPSYG